MSSTNFTEKGRRKPSHDERSEIEQLCILLSLDIQRRLKR